MKLLSIFCPPVLLSRGSLRALKSTGGYYPIDIYGTEELLRIYINEFIGFFSSLVSQIISGQESFFRTED